MTHIRVGEIPYLNSEPFYHGLPTDGIELHPMAPRAMGELAKAGGLDAGPFSLVQCFELEEQFEPLGEGEMGISVRGAVRSVVLHARVPVERLSGSLVGVTDETATSVQLMKLLLERRYHVTPSGYAGADAQGIAALLLIGDKALAPGRLTDGFPYRYDLAAEWLLWQGLPFVFAMWMVRKSLPEGLKADLSHRLAERVAANLKRDSLAAIAAGRSSLGLSYVDIASYLKNFRYIFDGDDRKAVMTFKAALQSFRMAKETAL